MNDLLIKALITVMIIDAECIFIMITKRIHTKA